MADSFESHHWSTICQMVTNKCLNIFPDIKSKKLKSEIISNLFETQSEKYFNSVGIETFSASSDRDPDLYFTKTNRPCEIKVTGIDHAFTNKCKWMSGKYSKRTSDFIFIIWNYQEPRSTLFGPRNETISFSVLNCFVDENEWKVIDSGKNNYYATVFDSHLILEREHKSLVGQYDGTNFILCEFEKNARII
jgi:hypothetical protein